MDCTDGKCADMRVCEGVRDNKGNYARDMLWRREIFKYWKIFHHGWGKYLDI